MRRVVWALALAPTAAFSQTGSCYDDAHLNTLGQIGLNRCAEQRFAVADAELNRLYAEVRPAQSGGTFVEAQRAWLAFRDLACVAETEGFEDGSMYPMILNRCLERQTNRRIEDLLQFQGLR